MMVSVVDKKEGSGGAEARICGANGGGWADPDRVWTIDHSEKGGMPIRRC
jgi:hypothetical protein